MIGLRQQLIQLRHRPHRDRLIAARMAAHRNRFHMKRRDQLRQPPANGAEADDEDGLAVEQR